MSMKLIAYLDKHFNENNNNNTPNLENKKDTHSRISRENKKKNLQAIFNSYEKKYKEIEHCFGNFNSSRSSSKNVCSDSTSCNTNNTYKKETILYPFYTRDLLMHQSAVENNTPSYEDLSLKEFQKQLRDIILNSNNLNKLNDKKELDENKYNDTEIPIIEKKNIDVEVNSLQDLINMINNNPIADNIEYNINMQMMHNIKPHLIELNDMIGMKSLKDNVVDQIIYFSQGLHTSSNKNEGDFMHTVIYGPPGTGKTEVSKILGKIYSKLGILTKNTFRKATRADLIAGYLGQTAIKTKDVINSCIGGVLFIDEAYSLGNEEKRDSFSKECIDTLCESLSDHKDKLMVIIAGYEKELENCFFNLNQGLNSRFPWRFKIEKYTPAELKDIFVNKINKNGWSVKNSENSIIENDWFEKNLSYFKYYGRDMETLFSKTKIAHAKRVFCKPVHDKKILTIDDINKGFAMFLLNEEVNNRNKKDTNVSHSFIYL